jgi:hypothetical protein
MKKVLCLEDGLEYFFNAISGYDAIQKMLYTLDIVNKDYSAEIELCNGRTWSLRHSGKTYACVV